MNRKKKPESEDLPRNAAKGEASNDEQEELLTTRELMDFLNLSRTKVWSLVTKGDLPAFKLGGDYRYRRSEILEWLEKYRVRH